MGSAAMTAMIAGITEHDIRGSAAASTLLGWRHDWSALGRSHAPRCGC